MNAAPHHRTTAAHDREREKSCHAPFLTCIFALFFDAMASLLGFVDLWLNSEAGLERPQAELLAVKRKSQFLLLPHKTQHHRNPVHFKTDRPPRAMTGPLRKNGCGGRIFGPMGFKRRWAYSTVWTVLSLPRPMRAPLERGKMVDPGITVCSFFLCAPFLYILILKYQHRTCHSSRIQMSALHIIQSKEFKYQAW